MNSRTHFADGRGVVFAEIGDGFEVWSQAARQPHRLDVALTLPLEPAARLNAVEIAVNINLRHHRGMIGWPSRLLGIDGAKTKLAEIKLIDEKSRSPEQGCPPQHSLPVEPETSLPDHDPLHL